MQRERYVVKRWFVFLLFLIVAAPLLGSREILQPVLAQEACPEISRIVRLVPSIVEQTSTAEDTMFFEVSKNIGFRAGQAVVLSSSPIGDGDLSTDDVVTVEVQPSGEQWKQDFRSPDRTRITVIPPQDITHMLVPGENEITLTLKDLTGPVFSSWAYFLVIRDQCSTVTPRPTNTPDPTNTPLPTSTASESTFIVKTVQVVETVVVTATPTSTIPTSPTSTPQPTVTDIPGAQLLGALDSWPLSTFLSWLPVGLVLGMGGTLVWWRVSNTSIRTDEIEVYKLGQYVRSYPLGEFAKRTVTIARDGDIELPDLQASGTVAQLTIPSEAHELVTLEVWDSAALGEVVEAQSLLPDQSITFEVYTLTYRSYDNSQKNESEEQEEQTYEY